MTASSRSRASSHARYYSASSCGATERGAINPEELFADDRSPAPEQERVHEDELHSLMRSILDGA